MDGELAAQPRLSFRILSLNAHKGFSLFNRRFVLHELRDAVRSVSADIVFLQEVLGHHSWHGLRHVNWPATPQYEFLADSIWSDFAYGRNAVYPDGHHGNALLSKFPIVRHHNHDISVGSHEKRGLLHCVLSVPGHDREIHAICVHFALYEQHRRQQLQLLCDLVQAEISAGAPLLVAGDFNDWRMRAHRVLANCAGLSEAFVQEFGAAARTFPARWPMLRLDRVYFRNLRLRGPRVCFTLPWSHLSDHAALLSEFEL